MIPLLMLAVSLIGAMCMAAYVLATYALPVMVAIAAARFAYATGAGVIGAGLVGLLAGAASFGLLANLFATLHDPAPSRRACLRDPSRHRGLCPRAWCDARSRSLRTLATSLLHSRRRMYGFVGSITNNEFLVIGCSLEGVR
ncbi:hypothetical protein [Rhizobium lentis]|uniref:hypothetical protein n=1 Tax=Rhizobium lentis TaxID=1138194 RepID=UPI00287FDAEE|nr:hypothetical protein [Rhizobium lentis]